MDTWRSSEMNIHIHRFAWWVVQVMERDGSLGSHIAWKISKVRLLYEPRYVITRIGNLTEKKSRVSMPEFPTGV
jgi:hypothetical protein